MQEKKLRLSSESFQNVTFNIFINFHLCLEHFSKIQLVLKNFQSFIRCSSYTEKIFGGAESSKSEMACDKFSGILKRPRKFSKGGAKCRILSAARAKFKKIVFSSLKKCIFRRLAVKF